MLQSAIETWPVPLAELRQVFSNRTELIDYISDDDCDCSISWHYSVNACEQHRKRLEVDSFKRWAKRVLLFNTWEGKDIIGLQRMIMVRRKW